MKPKRANRPTVQAVVGHAVVYMMKWGDNPTPIVLKHLTACLTELGVTPDEPKHEAMNDAVQLIAENAMLLSNAGSERPLEARNDDTE